MTLKMLATSDKAKSNTGKLRDLNLAAVKRTPMQSLTAAIAKARLSQSMVCCTDPGLTQAVYICIV